MAPKNLTAILGLSQESLLFLSLFFLFLLSPYKRRCLSLSRQTGEGKKKLIRNSWNNCQKCWLQARTYWKSVQFSMRIVFTNACQWTQSNIWEASLGPLIWNSFSKINASIQLYIWNCLCWSIYFEIESRRKNNNPVHWLPILYWITPSSSEWRLFQRRESKMFLVLASQGLSSLL